MTLRNVMKRSLARSRLSHDISELDMETGASIAPLPDMMTCQMIPMTRQHKQMIFTAHQPLKQRQFLKFEIAGDELDQFSSSDMDHGITTKNNTPHILQRYATHARKPNTQVPNVRDSKDKFHELEHLQLNFLRPDQKFITEEQKFHYFHSLYVNDAIEFWKTMCITPEKTHKDILDKHREEIAENDCKKVSKLQRDQITSDTSK